MFWRSRALKSSTSFSTTGTIMPGASVERDGDEDERERGATRLFS
jgi:hypothetical protein